MKIDNNKLADRYKHKRHNAESRGLEFTITKEYFINMFKVNPGKCDYTGMQMSYMGATENKVPKDYVTLERIDEKKGYVPGNCCLVRRDVNKLKEQALETNSLENGYLSRSDKALLKDICSTIYNPQKLQGIRDKYELKVVDNDESEDDTIPELITDTNEQTSEELIMPEKTVENVNPNFINSEISISREFYQLGSMVEHLGGDFHLTFTQFKVKMSRKTCEITGEKFKYNDAKTVWIKDKTKPVTTSNIMVTTKKLQNNLDTFMGNSKMSFNGFRKMCARLSK